MAREIDSRPSSRPGARRALRIVVVALGCGLAGVVALVVAVAVVPPLRVAALREGLRIADRRLPGTLTVARATWPRPGRLALEEVVWVDAPDTLACARRLELVVVLRPLLRREYVVRSVRVAGLRADVPTIRARFDTLGARSAPAAEPGRDPFGPEDLPRLFVADLRVDHAAVRVTPTLEIVASDLDLQADLRGDAGPRTLALSARALVRKDLGVALRFEAALGDSLVMRLSSIHLADPARLPEPSALPLDGRLAAAVADLRSLRADDPWPRLSARGIEVAGELGDLEFDCELRGREAGRVRGRLAPAPPPPWLADLVLGGVADSLADRLRPLLAERWPREASPTLAWDATFTPPAAGAGARPRQAAVTGEFVLPGPGDLASLLPARLRVDDLGALRGRFAARYAGSGDSMQAHLDLDLAGTSWLRNGRVRLDTDARSWVDVDSLALDMDGLTLRARGRLDRDRLDAMAVADLSSSLLARWDDPALSGIHGRLHADVAAAGTRDRPRLRADLDGRAEARGLALPAFSACASLDGDHLVLAFEAPDGLSYAGTALDTLSLDADVRALAGTRRYAGELTLAAGGRHGEFVVPRVDLKATLDDRHAIVAASMPAGLSHGPSGVDSARVDLDVTAQKDSFLPREGRLRLIAAGRHGGVVVPRLDLDCRLADSTVVLGLDLPAGLTVGGTRVDSLRCGFAGSYGDSVRQLSGRLEARGGGLDAGVLLGCEVTVARRNGPPAVRARVDSFALRRFDRGVVLQRPCNLAWDASDSLLRVEGLELRGRLGRLKGDLVLAPRQITGDLAWDLGAPMNLVRDLLPEDLLFAAEAETIAFDGRVRLSGTAADPAAHLETALELRDAGGEPALAARAQGWLRNPAVAPAADWPAAPDDAPARGLSARLSLHRGVTTLLDASARLPWQVSLQPAAVRPDTSGPGTFTAGTANLDLAVLDDLLPPGNRVAGRLDLDLKMVGRPGEWTVDGQTAGRKLILTLADGSWLGGQGELALRGDADSLDASGAFTIGSGLLRIPEAPPSLLPTSGELMLVAVSADTAVAAPADTAAPAWSHRLPLARAAVRVRIPGNLWLRGRGLNVEIAGDLTATTRAGRPAVEGDLRAVQGDLKLFGHFFKLERGLVVFKDDADALDPDLDIRLTTRVADTNCIVQMLGSVQKPQIELSSLPELSDEDIVSTLLFGRSLDELEEGQMGMVADRAAQVLASYGSVQLQDWASAQLGLDLVSIQPSREAQDSNSLVVGKYLNPQVVVRYEAVMAKDSAWYVYLDYLVTRVFKIHSEIFDGGSGLEMMLYMDR